MKFTFTDRAAEDGAASHFCGPLPQLPEIIIHQNYHRSRTKRTRIKIQK